MPFRRLPMPRRQFVAGCSRRYQIRKQPGSYIRTVYMLRHRNSDLL